MANTMMAVEQVEFEAAEASSSAVSWGPIIAGALIATVTSLTLLILGSGLGLSAVSPWTNASASATTLAVSTIVWIVIMQWVSSALGGYITGRLRTKWTGIHTDEVFFRDTAHGFLAWALSTLVVALFLSSALTSLVGGGVKAASSMASGAASVAAQSAANSITPEQTGYFTDMLFRAAAQPAGQPAPPPADANAARAEAGRILLTDLASGEISQDDRTYLAQLVSQRTGISAADAKTRVDQVIAKIDDLKTKAKQAADTARKSGITLSLVMFVSLLIGAFIASVSAAYAGNLRDEHEAAVVVR